MYPVFPPRLMIRLPHSANKTQPADFDCDKLTAIQILLYFYITKIVSENREVF